MSSKIYSRIMAKYVKQISMNMRRASKKLSIH